MGMYTELAIGVRFKGDTPQEIIDVLAFMATDENEPAVLPDHELFATERWRWMLRSGGSYYFHAQPCLRWKYDDIARAWFLTVWTNIKNYSGEWTAFLDFIAPYVDSDAFPEHIGHARYEEDDAPTILYACDGQILRTVALTPALAHNTDTKGEA